MSHLWKNQRPKEKLGIKNYFVFIWNGYEFQFFLGPFASHESANASLHEWLAEFPGTDDRLFTIHANPVIAIPQTPPPGFLQNEAAGS